MTTSSVFISYAHDTKPLVEELTQALQDNGIRTWVDFKDLQPGQQWQLELGRAIDKAQCFVVLVGPNSQGTPRQRVEWGTMLSKAWTDPNKRLLPVVVGSSEPPPFLRNWVSLKVDPTAEPQSWTERVVGALGVIDSPRVRDLTARSRRERQKRLNEIGKAVQTLNTIPLQEPHTVLGK
jgi:hypothetical protein